MCRDQKKNPYKKQTVYLGAQSTVQSYWWLVAADTVRLPCCPLGPAACSHRQLQVPCLMVGLSTGFWLSIWVGKTWPCFLANGLLESPGFQFSPFSGVCRQCRWGRLQTYKDRHVFTVTPHVSLQQWKFLLCESYFSPAEGELALIKTVGFFFPPVTTVMRNKISSE